MALLLPEEMTQVSQPKPPSKEQPTVVLSEGKTQTIVQGLAERSEQLRYRAKKGLTKLIGQGLPKRKCLLSYCSPLLVPEKMTPATRPRPVSKEGPTNRTKEEAKLKIVQTRPR